MSSKSSDVGDGAADDVNESAASPEGSGGDASRPQPIMVEAIVVDDSVTASSLAEEEAAQESGLPAAVRNPVLGAATAEGLSTMTPVTRVTEAPDRELGDTVLSVTGLTKRFGADVAVNDVTFEVRRGSFTGIVGPNGAGKTTTLSMATGLLKPSSGTVEVLGLDVWKNPKAAHPHIGILPDRLRLFDQLTGGQLLYYSGLLRGLSPADSRSRTESLVHAFELESAANRLVVDYSAGMTKKISLAAALIHSPELLVLDEPFDTIDPVSAGQLIDILLEYVQRGGTVLLSSHSMDLVQRVCDHVAVIVRGELLASGTVSDVRGNITLEERFRDLVRGTPQMEGLDWLDISFN